MRKIQTPQLIGLSVLGALMLAGVFFLADTQITLLQQQAEAEEAAQPASIELTLIESNDCEGCLDGMKLIEYVLDGPVDVTTQELLPASSETAQDMIETYKITKLPALVVGGEYEKSNVTSLFDEMGGDVRENAYVWEPTAPVYFDLASQKAIGLVDVTFVTDSQCSDCYDPTQHRSVLQSQFGMTIANETTVDIRSSEGRALQRAYPLTYVPTILLSPEASGYPKLTSAWSQVGSIAEDGTFVFQNNDVLGAVTYRDLETGSIIQPSTNEE